jgi:hypothetical protein
MEEKNMQYPWINTVAPEQKVAIIVPLYGYFKDLKERELGKDTLELLARDLQTSSVKNYIIFVAESKRLTKDVKNFLTVKFASGNVKAIEVEEFASYNQYIEEGIDCALNDTDANFIVVANPWITLRSGEIDGLIGKLNIGDASIISGFDVRSIGVSDEEFDGYVFPAPRAMPGFNYNFWGTTRQMAQMFSIDIDFKTRYFTEDDFYQTFVRNNFVTETSQYFPIYTLPVDWKILESEKDFFEDGQRFIDKWHFMPEKVIKRD